ncbi:glycosyltransferase [Terrarubrum flagellatum]|uniref:glycosyltransferase n=1 Tax=Terrirubrum flagellatum TaxID=2895980 RepID=UPI00314503D6
MIRASLQDFLTALAPGLAALGLCLLLMGTLKREWAAARLAVMAVSIALLARYFVWRVTSTLPPFTDPIDFTAGVIFLAAECATIIASIISMFFMMKTRERTSDVAANLPWLDALPKKPLIDVLICTYNEEEPIVERTIIGATGMDYPNYRVWVLDDGKRPWLQELCGKLGCGYITRPDNRHAKAGNINHALARLAELPEPPEFVSILDADFVPRPNFLRRAMSLFHDPTIGVVQTPQHFINPDPIQTNLLATQVWPDDQRFFFDIVMPARDAWGAAFCCGTSSIIRFKPLVAIKGFPTDSVTEDYLLTLRLKEAGYVTAYLNEALTLGLAPEGIKEYITQRNRWCLGFMQIVRGRSGPFSRRTNLKLVDRLSLIDSFLNWAAVYPARMLGLVMPILYLLLDVKSVHAELGDVANYFLPYFLWTMFSMSWMTRGRVMPIMSDVCHFVAAPAIIKAVFMGLTKPQGHKFKVTAKGGDRSRGFVEWPLLKIYGALLLLTILSIAVSFDINARGDRIGFATLALAWSWYNTIVLMIICFVCIEQPRRRKSERFTTNDSITLLVDGVTHIRGLADISISGAALRGEPPAPLGSMILCRLRGQDVPATIVRGRPGGFAVHFDASLATRVAVIRHFYASDYVRAFENVGASGVGKAVMKRIMG